MLKWGSCEWPRVCEKGVFCKWPREHEKGVFMAAHKRTPFFRECISRKHRQYIILLIPFYAFVKFRIQENISLFLDAFSFTCIDNKDITAAGGTSVNFFGGAKG